MRSEFRQQVTGIIQEILETVPRKRFDGGELTGAALAELAGHLTLTLKDGVPEVASAWHQVCLAQTRMALQRASESFKQSLRMAQDSIEASGRQKRHTALKPPMSSHVLKQTLQDATAAARSAYFATAFQTDEEQVAAPCCVVLILSYAQRLLCGIPPILFTALAVWFYL